MAVRVITDEVVTKKLTVGSAAAPSGITLYDEVTRDPYCLKMWGGALVSEAGVCGATAGAIEYCVEHAGGITARYRPIHAVGPMHGVGATCVGHRKFNPANQRHDNTVVKQKPRLGRGFWGE